MIVDILTEKQKKKTKSGADLSVQASCLECLRSLMHNQTGLQQVMNTALTTKKIASVLSSKDTKIKAMVLEILSFICLVPPKGLQLVLDAMTSYQKKHKEASRFASLIEWLKNEDRDIEFLVNCLSFINTLVNSPNELKTRQELRKEFLDMGVLEILKGLKDNWANSSEEIKTQVNVFEEEMKADIEEEKRVISEK